MNYRELFALGVRLFGVWLITSGVAYVASFIYLKLYPPSDQARDSAAANLIYATLDFGLAAFFLLWTRVIVAWSYGEQPGTASDAGTKSGNGEQPGDPAGSKTGD